LFRSPAEDVKPWRAANSAARMVGDHNMSQPMAKRRFQRSMTSSASRRAARSAFSLAGANLDVEPAGPDAHLRSLVVVAGRFAIAATCDRGSGRVFAYFLRAPAQSCHRVNRSTMLPEEIGEGLVGQLLEVLHAVLGELIEGVPSFIVELNALAGHGVLANDNFRDTLALPRRSEETVAQGRGYGSAFHRIHRSLHPDPRSQATRRVRLGA
jgi:hypothetical protein